MWSDSRQLQYISKGDGLPARDHNLVYPGRNKLNDATTGVSPMCLSNCASMGTCTCACMC
jgi:hypothetical protein